MATHQTIQPVQEAKNIKNFVPKQCQHLTCSPMSKLYRFNIYFQLNTI